MTRIRSVALAAAVVLTGGCNSIEEPSALGPVMSADRRDGDWIIVPFRGHIEGRLTVVLPFEPGSLDACNANFSGDPAHPGPSLSGFDDARGTFAIIGRIHLQSTFCLDPDSPFSEGTGVLTAMNGEQMFIGFENIAGVAGRDGVIPITGTQWITGGTGRFEGASGNQECRFFVDAPSLEIHGGCEGSIRMKPGRGARRAS